LPDALKDALLSGIVTEGHIRALAAIEDPIQIVDALRQILKEEGSVRRAEEIAREYKAKAKIAPKQDTNLFHNEELSQLQKTLNPKMRGGKVKITQSGRQARVVIAFRGGAEVTTELIKKVCAYLDQIMAPESPQND
jgi:ParB family chromosome partitioning protein